MGPAAAPELLSSWRRAGMSCPARPPRWSGGLAGREAMLEGPRRLDGNLSFLVYARVQRRVAEC